MPTQHASSDPKDNSDKELEIRRDESKGKIYSHLRNRWLVETPEETVRQQYLLALVNEYGYSLDQIGEEVNVTGRGTGKARADFVIWRTAEDKSANKAPFIVIECKSDNVTIQARDYGQGENYARLSGAVFFVTHNSRETKYWRVIKDKLPGYTEEIENIPHSRSTDKEVQELFQKLRVFKEKEFADLLHQCHDVIRNMEKLDPAAAFDEIAKVLFTKVYVERELLTKRRRKNIFSLEFLNDQLGDHPLDDLFQKTKRAYKADKLFGADEKIRLRPATGEEIVGKLERYNLSDTSEDIKGVAFEGFLGRTFRGEIGQFFTPRPIVEFMVRMIDPNENETVCDPASGSGGFLIRVFEIVREKILADADNEYAEFREQLTQDATLTEEEIAKRLKSKFADIQRTLDPKTKNSRLWKLANRSIYGTDANDRMARTSKMNMIMHGDGHGGVHHHDGFLNVNGVFEERFDVILTNPPFGSSLGPEAKITDSDVEIDPELHKFNEKTYGREYVEAYDRVKAAVHKPIASLFKLPKTADAKIKTEILFIERCLDLLKPGGRLGIVLPEGILNNPSLEYVRMFAEDRAYIRAVVSLPDETFLSSGASVKCSLLFMQKFTAAEQDAYDTYATKSFDAAVKKFETERKEGIKLRTAAAEKAKKGTDVSLRKSTKAELIAFKKLMDAKVDEEARQQLKTSFDYPIFMYEAQKVGIKATGAEEENELFPNPAMPADLEKSCLEWYWEFKEDPEAFISKERAI